MQIAVSDFVNRFNKSTGPRSVYVVNHMPLIFALPALSYSTQPHPKSFEGKLILCIFKETPEWFNKVKDWYSNPIPLKQCSVDTQANNLYEIIQDWKSSPLFRERLKKI